MHPDRIGPYLIDKRIGAGGMGNVYLGRHEQSGQVVAVKELPAALAREEGFVLRFNREIEAMQKLNCPNIVKLIDSGSDDDIYYYSMEYVDGDTLTAKLRREKRIPWIEVIDISKQICAGLKHAHDAGVVHRDLKPSNLMISKAGVVKIADFGVAQVFAANRLTSTGGVIGTAEFMSPEQVTGTRTDRRSDLYSLGAVIYTMLVGQPPFLGPTASDIMQKQRFGRFDPPKNFVPEIPSWLNDIVCQLLEKEPDKRPPDAFVTSKRLQEVVRKIELRETGSEALAGEVTRVVDSGPGQQLGATFVRDLLRIEATGTAPSTFIGRILNNTWTLIAALILVVIGAMMMWVQSQRRPDSDEGNSTATTEAERIVQQARWQWKGGDPHSALAQLDALQSVIDDEHDKRHLIISIDRLRAAISKQSKASDQLAFVENALERADKLPDERRADAKKIYEGIVELYKFDRRLNSFVQRARQKLETIEKAGDSEK